ncbi:hypothetical protein amb1426 [Paramagnetospirillum magneticum AMB-1]|uniref:ATP-grasp domain-containing protein n=2 Tax=Paramagnetospirillum magneticum TaxID=84159 RepID=Q2W7E6_PARM1|nr:hypothetical protein amb1426 [Paramagnetospirillum magneticum AMB-1]
MTVAPDWWSIARLPSQLVAAGFEVAAFCPPRSWLALTRFVCERYVIQGPDLEGQLADAVAAWEPHLVIPGDEFAVHLLRGMDRPGTPETLRQLVRRSCGDPRFHQVVTDKTRTLEEAARLDIAHPPQAPAEDFQDFATRHGYPLLLKMSVGMAGLTVRACTDGESAAAALARLRSLTLPAYVGQRSIMVQEHIRGRPASIALVALDGVVLDSFSYSTEETAGECGPSCVIRRLDHPGIAGTARKLVAHFGFSGFGGFDFMIEAATGTPHLLEMNPRLTIAGHLGAAFGHDLAKALHAGLSGNSCSPQLDPGHDVVALFPHEWWRDALSPHLRHHFSDVPWDDPALLSRALISRQP